VTVGFSFHERMAGKFHLLGEPLVERDISVEIEAHVRQLRAPIASVTGRIHAPPLAEHEPIQGTLGLHTLRERCIPYDLRFGSGLRLVGEKDLNWLAPVETLAVLPFSVVTLESEAWKEIARGELRFDVRHDWRAFARSLRVSPF
jgi:hypothetical protein